jgi:hypothetical protein
MGINIRGHNRRGVEMCDRASNQGRKEGNVDGRNKSGGKEG